MYTKKSDLAREYMPNHHSNRFKEHDNPDQAVLEHFLEVTSQQTENLRTRPDIIITPNIRYGGVSDRRCVDIYHPAAIADAPAPLFVYVHGGYWHLMDKSKAGSIVAPLVKRGYRVLVMDYNVLPHVRHTELVMQFRDFLTWLFSYSRDTHSTNVSFAGHSTGAYLLCELLNPESLSSEQYARQVRAIFLICGLYDLRELPSLQNVNPNNVFGLNAQIAETLSPICWDYSGMSAYKQLRTPVHVLSAVNESETFTNQSREYAKLLNNMGVNTHLQVFDEYDHYDILIDSAVEETPITSYMQEALGR